MIAEAVCGALPTRDRTTNTELREATLRGVHSVSGVIRMSHEDHMQCPPVADYRDTARERVRSRKKKAA